MGPHPFLITTVLSTTSLKWVVISYHPDPGFKSGESPISILFFKGPEPSVENITGSPFKMSGLFLLPLTTKDVSAGIKVPSGKDIHPSPSVIRNPEISTSSSEGLWYLKALSSSVQFQMISVRMIPTSPSVGTVGMIVKE